MKNNPELIILTLICLLTVMMWIYILPEPHVLTSRPQRVMAIRHQSGRRRAACAKAHANAVENLVIFAPLVVAAALLNVNNAITLIAAKIYLLARIVHYIAYTAGIPLSGLSPFRAVLSRRLLLR